MNRGWQVIYNSMNKNRESKSKNEAEQTLLKKKKPCTDEKWWEKQKTVFISTSSVNKIINRLPSTAETVIEYCHGSIKAP